MPPHRKCACHLLNLVATKDASKFDGALKTISDKTFSKLSAIWNKQNRSSVTADLIKKTVGALLVTPGVTRWNSTYDAIKKIDLIFKTDEVGENFDKIFDELGIKRLTVKEKLFISEYVEVMSPLSSALDILQGDHGYGYLLPTLCLIKRKIENMIEGSNHPLLLCEPLAKAILNGVNMRFSNIFNDDKAKMAAAVHPKFKTDWVDDSVQKIKLCEQLKNLVKSLNAKRSSEETTNVADQLTVLSDSDKPQDFFSFFSNKRKMDSSKLSECDEVDKYMADSSSCLSSLKTYPALSKLYVQMNTGLPSSAAVERLFSLGGRVLTPLRTMLSDQHFEMMMFMRSTDW